MTTQRDGHGEEEPRADLIPETLLALSYDERFVHQLRDTLEQIMEKDLHLDPDTCKLAHGISWLIYSVLVVRRSANTLGLDFCGLRPTSGKRLWVAMALEACASLALQHYENERRKEEDSTRRERLRGRARQRFHERQRRLMLERTQGLSEKFQTRQEDGEPHHWLQNVLNHDTLHNAKKLVLKTLLQISTTSTAQQGPHFLPPFNTTNNDNVGGSNIVSFAKWMVKLHIAHYCLTGRYPHWLHRIFRIRIERGKDFRNNLLANRPTTYRLVGMLIAIRAVTSVVKQAVHFINTQLIVPGNTAQRQREQQELDPTPKQLYATLTTQTMCGICGQPRTEPAAAKHCGHVFCWNCLFRWTRSKRPECPLCRASCQPQEVLALYYYCVE